MAKLLKIKTILALTFTFFLVQLPAEATKVPGKKLPRRNGDVHGKASYLRGDKDFENATESVVPVSRFRRRADYRTIEKERKEKEEQRLKTELRNREEARKDKQLSYKRKLELAKQQKREALRYNDEAVAFGQQGRWQEAIEAHEKAVKYDPSSKEFRINLSAARTALGQEKLKNGQMQAAAGLLRKALAAAPDNGMAGRLLSKALEGMGVDPGDADVRIKMGDQLKNSNDYQGAYIEYQQALKIEPSARTYVKMGDIELAYRRVNEALKWYGQALVKDPKYAPAHRQLGMLYLARRDNTKAAASLRKALILDSGDHVAGQALVGIWRDQVAKNPLSPEYHLGLAGALQLSGDFSGAESEYHKLQAIDPNNPGLKTGRASLKRAYHHATAEKHRKAAETLFGQGLKREALAEISQAVMMEPRNARYQFLLGECLEANNDYKGAHQAYLTCVLIDPENNKEAAARMKEMQRFGGVSANTNIAKPQPTQPQRPQPQSNYSYKGIRPGAQNQRRGFTGRMNMNRSNQIAVRRKQMQAPFNGKSMYESGQRVNPAFTPAKPIRPQVANRSSQIGGFGQMVKNDLNKVPANPQKNQYKPRIFPAVNADNPIENGGVQEHTNKNVAQTSTGNPGGTKSNAISASMAMVNAAEQQKDYSSAIKILKEMLNQEQNLKNANLHHRLAVNLMANGSISKAVTEFRIASALKPSNKDYANDLARALSVNKRAISHNGLGGSR